MNFPKSPNNFRNRKKRPSPEITIELTCARGSLEIWKNLSAMAFLVSSIFEVLELLGTVRLGSSLVGSSKDILVMHSYLRWFLSLTSGRTCILQLSIVFTTNYISHMCTYVIVNVLSIFCLINSFYS